MTKLRVIQADYADPDHGAAIVRLLDGYARDPMGGGQPIPADRLDRLVAELARRPFAFSLLAFLEDRAVGLANCFEGFSTFACRPLVNVHDIVVEADYRGRGIGRKLLEEVEQIARHRDCCKLTLEVLEGNTVAANAYHRFGFRPYELGDGIGRAMFWQKAINP